jgi:hypothetical protein
VAYRNPLDALRVALGLANAGTPVCGHREKRGELDLVVFNGNANCYRLSSPRRMRGVWDFDLELSAFQEDPSGAPGAAQKPAHVAWLDIEQVQAPQEYRVGTFILPGKYSIEFIGRRSLFSGGYGHFGMSQNLVVVDRVLSMRRTGPSSAWLASRVTQTSR